MKDGVLFALLALLWSAACIYLKISTEAILITLSLMFSFLATYIMRIANTSAMQFGSKSTKLSGKQVLTDILIPVWKDKEKPYIEHTVSNYGLRKQYTTDAYANVDYLNQQKYVRAQELKFVCDESTLSGENGILVSYVIQDDFLILGQIYCSPQSFKLITDSIEQGESIVLRVNGAKKNKNGLGTKVEASHFELLIGECPFGPKYFCKEFEKFLNGARLEDKQKLDYLNIYSYFRRERVNTTKT